MKKSKTTNLKNISKLLKTATLFCLSAAPLLAEEEAVVQAEAQFLGESREQIVKRLVDLGPGVHEVKKDSSGKLKSLKVVGSARISTVLGNAKGLQVAQQKAKSSANQAYIEWLNTNASSVTVNTEETVIMLSGAGDAAKEEGKASEKITNTIKTHATGLIRGLALVGKDIDSEGETLTLIYIWSPVRAAQAVEAAKANAGESGSPADIGTTSSKNGIKSKTTISPDFDE